VKCVAGSQLLISGPTIKKQSGEEDVLTFCSPTERGKVFFVQTLQLLSDFQVICEVSHIICIHCHVWSDSQVICIGSNLVNTDSNNYWSSSKLEKH